MHILRPGARRAPSKARRAIRVLIADDQRLFVEGVSALLKRQGLAVVGTATDLEQAATLARATRPDVALLAVAMPRGNGLDGARLFLTASPGTAVVLVTGSDHRAVVLEGMTLGVRGFVARSVATRELVYAIRAAARGATYVNPGCGPAVRLGTAPAVAADGRPLTRREEEVLRLVVAGKTNNEIGASLGISARTVDTHRTHLMRKLGIHDVAGLVRYAIREGLASA